MEFGLDIEDRRDRRLRVADAPPGKVLDVCGLPHLYMVVWNKTGRALVDLTDGFTLPEADHGNRKCRIVDATLVLDD